MPDIVYVKDDCTGCIFARPMITESENLVLKCHRFPPLVAMDPEDGELTQFRPDADLWCGEYMENTAENTADVMEETERKEP